MYKHTFNIHTLNSIFSSLNIATITTHVSILCTTGDDITEEEIDDMIAETDTDGSGTVDYEGKPFNVNIVQVLY